MKMQEMSTRLAIAVAMFGASVYVTMGYAPSEQSLTSVSEQSPRVVRAAGYVYPFSLREQSQLPSSHLAMRGTVTSVDKARYVSVEGAEYVYTPVHLEIDEWLRGERPAKEITLRIFGGTARGVTYEADFAPSPEVMSVGAELLVLGSTPIVVPGDEPVSAMTPVGVHLVRGDRVINATLADAHGNLPAQVTDLVDAELLLRASLQSAAAPP